MKCSICKSSSSIVWKDYESHFGTIALCYECLRFIDSTSAAEILSKTILCNTCNDKFMPKWEGQVKCGICWSKAKAGKTQKVFFTKSENKGWGQSKLMGVLI